jgi:hypothetical protein
MATGCYILPIGDDEVLPDGTLSLILNDLGDRPDVLMLDGWQTDPHLRPTHRHLPLALRGACFSSPSSAFAALWNAMPPGSFLVRKDFVAPGCFERYMGTSHAYAGAVWDYLAERYQETGQCLVRCMSIPTVLFRGGEKSWWTDAARIMLYEIPLWFRLLPKDYETVVGPILNRYLQQQSRISVLLHYRATKQLHAKNVEELTARFHIGQQKKARLVATIPLSAARLALKAGQVAMVVIEAVRRSRTHMDQHIQLAV